MRSEAPFHSYVRTNDNQQVCIEHTPSSYCESVLDENNNIREQTSQDMIKPNNKEAPEVS